MKELIRVMNLPRNIVAITKTSDGFYLGMEEGDCGFNAFFGKPSFHAGPGRDMSIQTWKEFNFTSKKACVYAARNSNVPLRNFLPKGEL